MPSTPRSRSWLLTTVSRQCGLIFNLGALGLTQRAIFEDSVDALLSDDERAYLASRKGKPGEDAPKKLLGAIARLAKQA